MGYIAFYKAKEYAVDIKQLAGSKFFLNMNGEEFEIDLVHSEHSLFSLLMNNRTYEVDLASKNGNCSIHINGEYYEISVVNEKKKAQIRQSANHIIEGKQEIKASMSGKIVKVLISANDKVSEGQGLIIVEAMKMENEIRAPKAGHILKVNVKEGETVENNTTLLVIE